jgi:predicted ATPase/DNA-binding CsgD family transcriptional regulator
MCDRTDAPPVPALAADSPTIPAASSGDLPAPVTALLGRDRDVVEVAVMLAHDGARLVTLTGPGGVGKTRLALAVAGAARGAFPGGVWFVPLAEVRDPALVGGAVARALGVRDRAGRVLPEALAAHLRGRRALLVLDNFEHLLAAVSVVSRILEGCPTVSVLATSRAPLRLRGEHAYAVVPLPVPSPGEADARALAANPAVALFCQRARAARHDFALTAANAAAVATLCAQLDGLPLALELAAARIRHLAPDALIGHLGARLPALRDGPRDAPDRHRALADAIAWSHDLLTDAERRVFRRLAVFAGGWTIEAAEAVCGDGEDGPPVAEVLAALADQSMVRIEAEAGPEPRHTMLETLREFAAAQLARHDEAEAVAGRRDEYFIALAERVPSGHRSNLASREWGERIRAEDANWQACLHHLHARGDNGRGLRLVAALGAYWWSLRLYGNLRYWVDQLLPHPTTATAPDLVQVHALHALANAMYAMNEFERAVAYNERALQIADRIGDARAIATSLIHLSIPLCIDADFARSGETARRAIDILRDLDEPALLAEATLVFAATLYCTGEYRRAESALRESLALRHRHIGERWVVLARVVLACVLLQRGARDEADRLLRDGPIASVFAPPPRRTPANAGGLEAARRALRRGDSDLALAHARAALDLAETGDTEGARADALVTLATVALAREDYVGARRWADDGKGLALQCGEFRAASAGGVVLARCHSRAGEYAAARLQLQHAISQALDNLSHETLAGILAGTLEGYGRLALDAGDADEATGKLYAALHLAHAGGDPAAAASAAALLALACHRRGQHAGALRLWAAAAATNAWEGIVPPSADGAMHAAGIAGAHAALGPAGADTAWAMGQAATLDAIVAGAAALVVAPVATDSAGPTTREAAVPRPVASGHEDRMAGSAASDAPLLPAIPQLVGRAPELALLRDALAAALAGRGGLVLIGGEAGIGKTTLAEALASEARAGGARALIGHCYALAETPPYGPWAEAIAALPPDAAPSPALADLAAGAGAASQAALFAQVWDALAGLAAGRPLVVVLDDLHWADPASLELLRFLARRLAGVPILILVTYRADELGRHHPLSATLPLLVGEARAGRLDLRPLDEAGLRALVGDRYALPAGDGARLVAYLRVRTEGNPFFVGELLRALREEGTLNHDGAAWRLGDLAGVRIPLLLRQVLDARLDRLGPVARDLLTVAAVIGQEVPLDLWGAVGGTDEDSLLAALAPALEARLLAEADDGMAVRFVHALVREALYEGLHPLRRRGWHRRVAEALIAQPTPDPDSVAYHLRRAGDARAGAWLAHAGRRAQAAHAYLTAAERFEAALARAGEGGGEGAVRERGWLLVRLARVRGYADPRQGIVHLEEAARVAAVADDPVLTAYVEFLQGDLHCSVGDLAGGLVEMAAAGAALDALAAHPAAGPPSPSEVPPAERVYHGTLVFWLADAGRYAEARAVGEGYIARPAPPAPIALQDRADAFMGLADTYASLGQVAASRQAYARARELYRAIGHQLHLGWAALFDLRQGVLRYATDDLAERERLAAEAERAWRRAADAQGAPSPDLARLPLLVLEGRWEEAARIARATDAWSVLGPLARHRGDAPVARAMLRRGLPEGLATRPGGVPFLTSLVARRLAAALALDEGDLPLARRWLEAHDGWLAWSGGAFGRAEGHLGWAAYHRAAGDAAAARASAGLALTHAADPRQPLALLAAHRLLGELATAGGHQADAAAHLDAAFALAGACAAPYERALTLLALAELRATSDSTRPGAEDPLGAARLILTDLGAAPDLARTDALAARLARPAPAPASFAGLTVREAEVLRLVAAGLSNAAIAERLFVSVRTVSTHLTSVYGKLGVASRGAAIRRAFDLGLT